MSDPWTPKLVEARLTEAWDTLRSLPDREHAMLTNSGSCWPDMLKDWQDVYALAVERGGYEAMEEPRFPPTAGAIDRMDEALPWLDCLDQHARRLVMLRIRGREWYVLAGYLRKSESTAKRQYCAALGVIVKKLGSR